MLLPWRRCLGKLTSSCARDEVEPGFSRCQHTNLTWRRILTTWWISVNLHFGNRNVPSVCKHEVPTPEERCADFPVSTRNPPQPLTYPILYYLLLLPPPPHCSPPFPYRIYIGILSSTVAEILTLFFFICHWQKGSPNLRSLLQWRLPFTFDVDLKSFSILLVFTVL